jgi:hypothetical protein
MFPPCKKYPLVLVFYVAWFLQENGDVLAQQVQSSHDAMADAVMVSVQRAIKMSGGRKGRQPILAQVVEHETQAVRDNYGPGVAEKVTTV